MTNLEWANRFAHVSAVRETCAANVKIASVEAGHGRLGPDRARTSSASAQRRGTRSPHSKGRSVSACRRRRARTSRSPSRDARRSPGDADQAARPDDGPAAALGRGRLCGGRGLHARHRRRRRHHARHRRRRGSRPSRSTGRRGRQVRRRSRAARRPSACAGDRGRRERRGRRRVRLRHERQVAVRLAVREGPHRQRPLRARRQPQRLPRRPERLPAPPRRRLPRTRPCRSRTTTRYILRDGEWVL